MIGLIGIFVITSSACFTTFNFSTQVPNLPTPNGSVFNKECVEKFVRVSTSSDVAAGEVARPVCFWIEHKWVDKIADCWTGKGFEITQCEYSQCVYCDKKRIRKDVWEDVK